jgi:hypothetical protein
MIHIKKQRTTLPRLFPGTAPAIRRTLLIGVAALVCAACGASSSVTREEWLRRLNAAIHAPVDSRETNRQNSRTVQGALDQRALEGLMRFQVMATLGPGTPCRTDPKCHELGFYADDLYYTVGDGSENEVGKLPILIVGFDKEGYVGRAWNLRIH